MRYVARAFQWYAPLSDGGDVMLRSGDKSSITVVEDLPPSFTGLYTATGEEIHRLKEPIGFRIPE